MWRGVVFLVVAGVAGLIAAALSSGSEPKPAPAAAAKPAVKEAADLPPLPKKMRPKVVEPVAGSAGTSAEAVTDPGLEDVGPKPTGPASAGATRQGGAGSTDITKATALANGVALPPLEAPEEVKQIIEAGNIIARSPYVWGGGHGKWLDKGYDCSGSVSFALAAAGLLNGPLASGPLMSWGKPGPGKWVTIYSSPGHVFMYVAGIRFDTSAQRIAGSRWENELRSTAGFVARHPEGL
jgi:cell wall-associated NlpC family hydrolase